VPFLFGNRLIGEWLIEGELISELVDSLIHHSPITKNKVSILLPARLDVKAVFSRRRSGNGLDMVMQAKFRLRTCLPSYDAHPQAGIPRRAGTLRLRLPYIPCHCSWVAVSSLS